MITFTPAIPADIPAFTDIIRDTFVEYGWIFRFEDELPDFVDYPTAYTDTPNRLFAMRDGARVIGCVALKVNREGAYLSRVYLARSERGKGLGKAMVRFILDEARKAGHPHVHLWTDTRFLTAHRLYEHLGFRRANSIRSLHDTNISFEYRYDLDLG